MNETKLRFKAGDRVRVTEDKASGSQCMKGDVARIEYIRGNHYNLDNGWFVDDEFLELVPDPHPLYQWTGRTLTVGKLLDESNISTDEARSVIAQFGLRSKLNNIKDFLEYASQHECFIEFLLEDGYVEKVEPKPEPEKFYEAGDRFMCFGTTYMISHLGNGRCILTSLEDGNWWSNERTVEYEDKITQREFDLLTNGKSHEFIKIPKEPS